jgi:predicted DCC family thiol-disulfide oxidoreductase YuxK
MAVTIFYDGQCPFCSRYVALLRLREAVGPVGLVDLRADDVARAKLEAAGAALDQGMVVELDGRRLHGADAVHGLTLLSSPSGILNRLNAWLFASKPLARLVYPLLRAGRNATLLLLDRRPLATADAGWQSLFTLFSLTFGLFGLMHVMNYAFEYGRFNATLSGWLILPLSMALMVRPGSHRLFVALVLVMGIDAWLQAPIASNHTILRNFFLLAVFAAGLWHWLQGSGFLRFFADVVPVGRSLLLVMYVFGIFHKINTDFLDPAVSCAVTLWRAMPPPLAWLEHELIHWLVIYGTFVAEGLIILMLLAPRLRHWGIGGGIAFHGLLALSDHALYPAFSSLAIALHVLFIAPTTAERIVQQPKVAQLLARLGTPVGLMFVVLIALLVAVQAVLRQYSLAGVSWLLFLVPMAFALAVAPGRPVRASSTGPLLWSPLAWLNIVSLLFFLNNTLPYVGLKTAQTINMFANLRLEGGVSNHLLLGGPPGPFRYLEDVVTIERAEGSPMLERLAMSENELVYYALLDQLDRTPEAVVTFTRNGEQHVDETARTLASDIDAILHPAWVRKWFHFRDVDRRSPKPCSD